MMNFEIGKEYLYFGNVVQLVCIDNSIENVQRLLIVYKFRDGYGMSSGWVSAADLTDLSPYHDFKRGEPVMAGTSSGDKCRRYFSHVGENNKPYCFENGMSAWTSEEMTSAWSSVRKLTPEEREEYNKCL